MGDIKQLAEFEFTNKTARLLWDYGESDERGLEIQLDIDHQDGSLEGIHCSSFGYENWSQEIWEQWGDYLENRLEQCHGNNEKLNTFISEIREIDCIFTSYNEEDRDFNEHLNDINKIREIVAI